MLKVAAILKMAAILEASCILPFMPGHWTAFNVNNIFRFLNFLML